MLAWTGIGKQEIKISFFSFHTVLKIIRSKHQLSTKLDFSLRTFKLKPKDRCSPHRRKQGDTVKVCKQPCPRRLTVTLKRDWSDLCQQTSNAASHWWVDMNLKMPDVCVSTHATTLQEREIDTSIVPMIQCVRFVPRRRSVRNARFHEQWPKWDACSLWMLQLQWLHHFRCLVKCGYEDGTLEPFETLSAFLQKASRMHFLFKGLHVMLRKG